MIELDGIQYNIATPEENAGAVLSYINNFCANNNITNSKGEIVEITANWANPLYVILYGICYLVSQIQTLVYSAGRGISIAESSDQQLLNLADLAHIRRKAATKTSIVGTVYSNLAGDGAVPCVVTTSLAYTAVVPGGTIVFHPAYDVTIPVGSSRNIILIAETYGAYSLAAGQADFDANPEGFRLMSLQASAPGQDQESIDHLRMRLQRRVEKGTAQDQAIDAISELEGVSACNIAFNQSVINSATINGIEVPPRQALIFVQGYSPDITETFYRYMLCECAGSTATSAIEQIYNLPTGQQLKGYIIPPENIPIYIRVYINQAVDDITKQAMRDTIASLARQRTIGQTVTSAEITQILQATYPSYDIAGCKVGLSDTAFDYQAEIGAYQLVVFNNNRMQIFAQGEII